jgi:hypothetical protein
LQTPWERGLPAGIERAHATRPQLQNTIKKEKRAENGSIVLAPHMVAGWAKMNPSA